MALPSLHWSFSGKRGQSVFPGRTPVQCKLSMAMTLAGTFMYILCLNQARKYIQSTASEDYGPSYQKKKWTNILPYTSVSWKNKNFHRE